jgi:hypothetical protein
VIRDEKNEVAARSATRCGCVYWGGFLWKNIFGIDIKKQQLYRLRLAKRCFIGYTYNLCGLILLFFRSVQGM